MIQVTAENAVRLLNELNQTDNALMTELFKVRAKCNVLVEEHPTVQVEVSDDRPYAVIGFVGILNGLFGIYTDKVDRGPIIVVWEDDRVVRFELRDKRKI